jgi:DnaJ-class molecular chaperone
MFNYDGWLESGYTDSESGCDEDCPVCWNECEGCNGQATLDNKEACPDCNGEGGIFDPQSKSEHRDYYEPDYD